MVEVYGRTVFLVNFFSKSIGDEMVSKNLKGEKPLPQYELLTMISYIPSFIKPVLMLILKLFGMERESHLLRYSDNSDIESLHTGCLKKMKVLDNHMEYWRDLELD